jgi:hypothetical protein
MAQQPDMILLVGDYVHTHHGLPYLRRAAGHTRAAGGVRRAGQRGSRSVDIFTPSANGADRGAGDSSTQKTRTPVASGDPLRRCAQASRADRR